MQDKSHPMHIDIPPSVSPNGGEQGTGAESGQQVLHTPNSNPDFKPRGILKNAHSGTLTGEQKWTEDQASQQEARHQADRLTWDEQNINLNEINRDATMKIDEPKTPFVKGDGSFGQEFQDVPDFELSGSPTSERRSSMTSQPSPGGAGRRKSEQELLLQNTQANAGIRRAGYPFGNPSETGTFTGTSTTTNNDSPRSPSTPDSPMRAYQRGGTGRASSISGSSAGGSRSASFSLPDQTSGSARRMMGADGQPGDEVEEDEEIKESDPRHKDFKKKRAGHYGGEAEAMKLAQALMAQENLNDDE